MEKIFSVPNISCGHCVRTIQNELYELAGVKKVTGNANEKKITVEWSAPLTEEEIRALMAEINYPSE